MQEALNENDPPEAMTHSNYGFHYTPKYRKRVKEDEIDLIQTPLGKCLAHVLEAKKMTPAQCRSHLITASCEELFD